MSRVGKKPITLVKGVTVQLKGSHMSVQGPKGSMERNLHPDMRIEVTPEKIVVLEPKGGSRMQRGLFGLTRTLIFNMVKGVTDGFEKALEVRGIGYRAQVANNKLTLFVGYSHPVEYVPPKGITIEAPKPTNIIVKGIDKELVGAVAADLRFVRKPEPYKGKGIRYDGELVRTKVGKAGASGSGAGAAKSAVKK